MILVDQKSKVVMNHDDFTFQIH